MNRATVLDPIRTRFRIDTRSLAVFRIVAGILIVVDVCLRFRNFNFFYTDEGVFPVSLAQSIATDNAVSIFYISGDPTVTFLLFVLHILVGVQLLLGYHTRLASVLAFLFVVSLDLRAPLVTSYADILFRHLLFWGMFLPLGERYSLDAIRANSSRAETYTGLAGAFILLQIVFMYIVNGSHKIPWREDWLSGLSMTGILHYDSVSWLLGPYLREFPLVMQAGSVMWYTLMLGSPMLLLLAGRARYFGAITYASGHLFMAATVRIGAFPYVALMGLSLFCTTQAWRDGEWFIRRAGLAERADRAYRRVTRWGERLVEILPWLDLADRVPSTRRLRQPLLTLAMVLVILSGSVMVVANAQTLGAVDADRAVPLQEDVEEAQSMLRLGQPPWRFYQGPIRTDEYYVFPGITESGEQVDVYNDRPMSWDPPHGGSNYKQLDTYRERFYMYGIENRGDYDDGALARYRAYLCENYRTADGDRLTHLNMYVIEERRNFETIDDPDTYDRKAVLIDAGGCGNAEPVDIELPPPELTPDLPDDVRDRIERTDDDLTYLEYLKSDDE